MIFNWKLGNLVKIYFETLFNLKKNVEIYGEDDEESYGGSGILKDRVQDHNSPLLMQSYRCIERSGPEGMKQKELAEQLGLNQLDARCVCRSLVRFRLVDLVVKDVAKNRVFVYVFLKISISLLTDSWRISCFDYLDTWF